MTDSPGRPTPDAPGPDAARPADDATSPDRSAPEPATPPAAAEPTPAADGPTAPEPTPSGEAASSDGPVEANGPATSDHSEAADDRAASDGPAASDRRTSLDKPAGPESDRPAPQAPAPGWAPVQPPAAGWGPPHQGADHPGAASDPRWGGTQPLWGAPPGWNGPYVQAAKPGVIPLRPLSVGEILDGAFAAMRTHWKVMIGIAVVIALLTQCLEVPATWLLNREFSPGDLSDDPTGEELWRYLRDTFAILIVPIVVSTLGQIAATGMLTVVVSRAVIAKSMTAAQAWKAVRPLLPRLLGVTFATWLVPVGTLLVAILPGLALLAVGADGLGALLLLPGLIGGIVAAIYLYVCLTLAGPVLMLEKQTVRKALERSRKLVTGSWWRVCGILLLISLIMAIVGGIIQMPFLLLSDGFTAITASKTSDIPDPTFVDLLITGIGAVISSALLYPFAAGATALLYIDQRIRREALDLELARAAGVLDEETGTGSAAGPTPA
ncbi:glycerophosphoryl diester phosphodiesterase membrane domain-containing protein [Embleya sp. NPDC055664]